ncbi:peptidase MA family metallohydrolase [Sandaracinus amylolyticus]|uniref:TPR domain protein n=1 Tax=Sandaracinus amylolyticus TaxID=927083 RepID=A0A0F6YIW5_9BACT|nr:tetratricopeptide repeat protein [Sandaracinus amylolyticus]AKF06228.1 TPR domain protein [Sandaracinus amylolyticus]
MKLRALAIAFSLSVLAPSLAHALPPGADGARLRDAAIAIDEVRIEEAEPILASLATTYPDDPDVRWERAMLRFVRGDYAGAARDGAASVVRATHLRSAEERVEIYRLMWATREVTRRQVEQRSEDGRYVVRFAPGPDRVLAEYAIETMRAADEAMQRELGVRVPGPIRVEIYPTAATLSEVSSLSVEEIERTGTIALCKWDRLMITSPRALVRGYPWADTLGHEFVHMVLSRASRDRAPVWMQEGVARFLERTWRGGEPAVRLDPASDFLLRRAVQENQLLSFDRLHPSIAMLPSAEDAALAFAQVSTFVERFRRVHGRDGLRRVVQLVADGTDARAAFAEVADTSWDELERAWRAELRERPEAQGPAPALARPVFRHGEAELDDTQEVRVETARRHLRIGDLLWSRQRPLAASHEYDRAWQNAEGDPIVGSRLARASLAGGAPDRAIAVLTPLTERWPDHEPLWAVLGSAHLARGEHEQARAASLEALRLNPFDPQPHCDLAQVATSESERTRENGMCRDLQGSR